MTRSRWFIVCAFLAYSTTGFAGEKSSAGIQFFESKIRPVLVTHCYECHSEKAPKLKGKLLLDSKEGMLKGGISGSVLLPGKAKESLLIKALEHDGDTKMPPKAKLSKEVIADFVRWIDLGAPDPRTGKVASTKRDVDIEKGRAFWSFRPLSKEMPPKVKHEAWVKTPIDRFILATLEEKGLKPNDAIALERLARRAFYDVLGLPPTPAELEAFLKDAASAKPQAAFERLVDRLLASERHGERWARHWFDLVRFAESGGYEFDKDRPSAHHYRDFVVKALNDGMPFDEFVRLQIAGDLLKPGDFQATAATGFLVAGPFPGQTTAKTIQLIRYDHLDDMVATIGSSMLGLSLGCARCHEHKYDPIPQEDYYRLIANLGRTDSVDAKVNLDPAGFAKVKAEFDQAHAPLLKKRDEFEQTELSKHVEIWHDTVKERPNPWLTLDAVDAKSKSPLVKQPDGSLLATGKAEKNDTATIVAQTLQRKIKAIRIDALADKALPKGGPGRSPAGVFVLTDLNVTATPLNNPKAKPIKVTLRPIAATAQDEKYPLAATIDGDRTTGWSISKDLGKDHAALFEVDGDVGFDGGTILTFSLKYQDEYFAIGRTRIAISTAPAKLGDAVALQHAGELHIAAYADIQASQREAIGRWLRKFDKQVDDVYRAVEEHAKTKPQPKLATVFSATSNKGGDVHFLIRGEVEKKREIAKPGFVQVLSSPLLAAKEGSRVKGKPIDPRIALASWLTDADHGAGHLLARVIVNRLWQHHMGKGIVGTPNDFGAQGDAPTHPELLDYLARELIKNGWRLRPIHKLIMTSAVYQLSPELNEAAQAADPKNALWWRHPTRRLEAEAIRDAVLAVSGTLDPKMFGPGTLDGNSQRRSVYLTVKRSQMVPMLQMFDMPEAMQSVGERSVTTVPTQSLAFMNSPLVRGAAQKFAARLKKPGSERSEPSGYVDQAYLIALSRRPTNSERERMQSFIDRQAASYGMTPAARDQALVDFCQVMLCLNEFIYVD
jgi:hypothetical protein